MQIDLFEDFIRTSQSLQIVALLFYLLAGISLVSGLAQRSAPLFFFGSGTSILLTGFVLNERRSMIISRNVFPFARTLCFVLVVFSLCSVCLFAVRGKSVHIGSLSFSWWAGLLALIISFIDALALIVLSFYVQPMEHNKFVFWVFSLWKKKSLFVCVFIFLQNGNKYKDFLHIKSNLFHRLQRQFLLKTLLLSINVRFFFFFQIKKNFSFHTRRSDSGGGRGWCAVSFHLDVLNILLWCFQGSMVD